MRRTMATTHRAITVRGGMPARLQDRVEQVIQRFEMMRDRADQLIRAAERIFPPGRSETTHKESGPSAPSAPGAPADPA
jgi:hypothetical protein